MNPERSYLFTFGGTNKLESLGLFEVKIIIKLLDLVVAWKSQCRKCGQLVKQVANIMGMWRIGQAYVILCKLFFFFFLFSF